MASRNTSGRTRLQIIRALAHGDGKRKMVELSGLSSERMWHRSSVSPAGSFVASTGLLPQSSPNDDAPVSPCGFISVSVSFVRLLPALPPLFPNSRFVGNILTQRTEQEYNNYS
ncbi:hypothetical protein T03_13962 [Trichinella britovi]|uniref:Uncharacterized protein n=1 Tax=Trichinella britovi TaxID=45882 RepID=A0A0V1CTG8_TRIBR|nr:hypothetical protein T03_13962 [Trichinella britovi]